MAACAAAFSGLSAEEIRTALDSFQGVARRQEVRGTVNGVTVVDDFAHHPTAIRQAIACVDAGITYDIAKDAEYFRTVRQAENQAKE
jgi:UDP-N-acetylmuramate-alanine ligase